ncbi:flagellar hook-basal body complex protein FliE [Listeria costaricensis]|uniref:flagellar hook-basal body complex protein FliE n=1 Tax=Listeria costaricensis TaxID=2026604 RepID=UPI000C0810DD|nr:flagellar hook-basal body complex protein FliE [Listeria costaricensis]
MELAAAGQVTALAKSNLSLEGNQSAAKTGGADQFAALFDQMSGAENSAQNAVYKLLTTGEGNASDVLIQMKSVESQMKTAAVVRDNVIENYKQLLNTQI